MIGTILKSSEYPNGTTIQGKIIGYEISGFVQYIHFNNVLINGFSSDPVWMRATVTLGDFLEEQGYNALTMVGHVIHMEKSHKRLQGFNGTWHDSDFFVPVRIE